MSILYFDLFAGCSGDMILGALVDLGADFAAIETMLAALPVRGYRLECGPILQRGIRATRFQVILDGEPATGAHDPHLGQVEGSSLKPVPGQAHPPGHSHAHGKRGEAGSDYDSKHEHGGGGRRPAGGGHSHRTFAEIRRMLEKSDLPTAAVTRAVAVFELLARAEGRIHGQPPEEVAFHEVGAVDSIMDITGIALALDQLGFTGFACSPVNVGSGTLTCAHGVLPVPAPAATELLQGFPVYAAHFEAELVTPTGAAVLRTLVKDPGRLPPGALRRIGYGAGSRRFPNGPNVLRLMEIEPADDSGMGAEVAVLECQLDDMNPELLAALAQSLLADGALDVSLTPIQMKKFRPGTLLTLLCRPPDRERFAGRILAESTTFGLRWHLCRREELDRRHLSLATRYGTIQVKAGLHGGRLLKVRPEFEECRRLADAAGVGVDEVYREVEAAIAAAWPALARQLEQG
jgi:uncharacterized protein (TIGR00299 family) protein